MNSVWQSDCNLPEFPELKEDCKTDILIIGGGIAGILTAYFLYMQGVDYILAEKNKICSGTTQNTTAKITFQHGFIYRKLIKRFGVEKARGYLEANKYALLKYFELCKNIDCDFEIKNNYVYSLDDRLKTENELSALERIGYNAKFTEKLPLPIKTAGAVMFPEQAQFHPLRFLSSISKNLNIYENTFIKEMIGTTAVTDFGKIKAQKVIVATHFPFINKHGSYFLKLYQHRSYVIALKNAAEVDGMYVDESKTGLSFRNHGDLLLIGGGDHRTGKHGGNWRELRDFARVNYPDAKEQFFWVAQDCMSLDDMPYVGNYSKNTPNLYTASGFNKWGMTGAMAAALILSDTVLGKKNEFADIFNPSRSIFRPQLLLNGFETAKNLLTPTTKRCPHLGCALKWNNAEHTWDCPCHGTRINEQGKIVDNPANGR